MAYNQQGGCWLIQCEPHVALRFKRVFPKIDARQVGWLMLTDTPENARDLEWFLQRYPLECDGIDVLRRKAAAHREQETLIHRMLSSTGHGLDFPLAEPAREYQKLAAELARTSGHLLLADDVGLGKSLSAICAFLATDFRPALVVTLAHLPAQWIGFVQRFAPHLRCHVLRHGVPYDLRGQFHQVKHDGRLRLVRDGDALPDVILSSYHKLSGWAETLAPLLRTVVWDECQELRHSRTFKHGAASYLAARLPLRMGLSATPIYNYGAEIFNVMECIAPGALGSSNEFFTEWCHEGDSIHNPRALAASCRAARPFRSRWRRTRWTASWKVKAATNWRRSFCPAVNCIAGRRCRRRRSSTCACGRRRASARLRMWPRSCACWWSREKGWCSTAGTARCTTSGGTS